jgi:hypothetical protein
MSVSETNLAPVQSTDCKRLAETLGIEPQPCCIHCHALLLEGLTVCPVIFHGLIFNLCCNTCLKALAHPDIEAMSLVPND